MRHFTTATKQAEQNEAKQFLDFIDGVACALYGCVFEDLAEVQRVAVLEQVELLHQEQVN